MPDSVRDQLLDKAKLFKSGWVTLAEALSRLVKSREYEAWGYASLEAYCLKELHIRKQTVAKLVGNYQFLERREPALLAQEKRGELPDIETLNMLAKASTAGQDTYESLREGALNKGYSAATLYRKLKDTAETAPEDRQDQIKRRIRSLAHSIRLLMAEEGDVPPHVQSALQEIEEYAAD